MSMVVSVMTAGSPTSLLTTVRAVVVTTMMIVRLVRYVLFHENPFKTEIPRA